jgi:crossover junction endodeoxyribonuclease RuvC
MLLLGLDPGLLNTGWGIVSAEGNRLRHVANGVIRPPKGDLATRLLALHEALAEMLARTAPDEAAVEETFVNVNGQSTLKLGQARGVVMLAPALAGIPVTEYPTNTVKKSIVGFGHAGKDQIGHMVRTLLPGVEIGSPDAADALAVAICHAHHASLKHRLAAAR